MAVSLQDISDNGPTLKSYAMTKLGEVEFCCPTEGEFITQSLEWSLFTGTISQTCTDGREDEAPELDSDHRESDWGFINNSKEAVLSFLFHNPCFSGA